MAIGGFLGSALAGLSGYDRAQQEAQQNQDRQIRTRMLMQEFQQRQQQDQFKQQVLGLVGRLGGMDGLSRLMGGGAPPLQQVPQTPMPQMGGGQPDQLVPQRTQPGQDMGGGLAAGGALTGGIPARGTPERERLIDTIFRTESGNRNIPQGIVPPGGGYNPSVGRVTGPSTASGPGQITDSTLRDVQKTDPALAGYSRAMDMPIALQRRATDDLIDKRGVQPWAPYNAKLRQELAKDPQLMQGSQEVGKQVAQSIPPMAQGKMGLQQLAQMINEAAPDASDAVKGAALIQLHELLAPYEKMQFQQQLKEQMGTGSHYFETDQGPVVVRPGQNRAEPIQLPGGAKLKGTADEKGWTTMEMTMPDGTKQPVRVQASSGKVEPLQLPGGGAGLTKVGTTSQSAPDPKTVDFAANAIAGYKMAPLSGWAMRSKYGQDVMAKVYQVNPDYDQTKYNQKARAEIAFTTGRQGDSVRSFSVSIDHLAVMDEAATALANGDTQGLNKLKNEVQKQFGYEGPVDFNFIKSVVGAEVSKAIIGGVGALTDREELRDSFSTANSPEQLAGVAKMAKRLMAGQLSGYRRQGASGGFSEQDFEKALSPLAKKELESLPAGAPDSGAAAPPAASTAPTPQAGPQEGDTATNPTTGETLTYRNGQWVK